MNDFEEKFEKALAATGRLKEPAKTDRPCRNFLRGIHCGDEQGRDHCFNCARHLDPATGECPKGCGNHGEEHDEKISNIDQDAE